MSRQRKRRLSLESRITQLEALIKDMQTELGLRRLREACEEESSPVGQLDALKQYQAWLTAQQQAQLRNIWPQGQIISQPSTTNGTIGSLLGTVLSDIAQVSGITKTTT